ncbi:MAG: DUF2892 domain-containing protein [Chloroflexota bacterium]
MFKLNEASWDRIVRVVLGVVLFYLGWGMAATGWDILLMVVGAVLLLTGLLGFCPLYFLFKFSTRRS